MAVATDREYGLLIGGEYAEPASGEDRGLAEPVPGEALPRATSTGEAYVHCARPINPFGL